MSDFIDDFNVANEDFAAVCAETFQVLTLPEGATPSGECSAISIEDLEATSSVQPGVLRGENTVIIFIDRTTMDNARIVEGAKLLVRGKRVRVNSIVDQEDSAITLNCGSTGAGRFA